MPTCPKCGVEVDRLHYRVMEEHTYSVTWHTWKEAALHYEAEHRWEPSEDGNYLCPECEAGLFTTEDEAIAFLKG